MSEKLPVSVHILTWNSGQTLERTLKSVKQCAEIIIIDGGSQDETVAIAEKFGARVVPQRFPGAQGQPLGNFAAARNVGLEHATQPWVLALDSDEQMSGDAMAEIAKITKADGTIGAYYVPRKYLLENGKVVDLASTYPNERIYFFRRDAVSEWQKPVHERVVPKPGTIVGHLKSGSLAPLAPLGVFRSKLSQYLRIEVKESADKGLSHWLHRVWRTLRGRLVATLRLMRIWLIPHPMDTRLPFSYELARFWYAWKLIVMTFPGFRSRSAQ
jgi:glycosyltransferase involved in cell wall biosynthesis